MIAEFYGGKADGNRFDVSEHRETVVIPEMSEPQTVSVDGGTMHKFEIVPHIRRFCVLPDRHVFVSIDDPYVRKMWLLANRADASVVYAMWVDAKLEQTLSNALGSDIESVSGFHLSRFDAIADRKATRKKVFG